MSWKHKGSTVPWACLITQLISPTFCYITAHTGVSALKNDHVMFPCPELPQLVVLCLLLIHMLSIGSPLHIPSGSFIPRSIENRWVP